MNAHNNADAVHDKVFKLLPWRINETLTSNERKLVDAHIKTCPTCKQESSLLQATFNAALITPETVPDVHSSLAKSLRRIESESLASVHQTPSIFDHLRELVDGFRGWFNHLPVNRMTIAATGFAIVFVALITLQQRPSVVKDDYSVLSSPIVSDDPTRLAIDFTTDLSKAQAEAVLRDVDPGLLSSAKLQYLVGRQYILTLPTSYSIQQISKLIGELQTLPAIMHVDMQAPD